MHEFDKFSREELLKIIEVYAKNWLAHDGCWFLAAEEKYGMNTAIELDIKSWERFAVSEAKRIKKTFDIADENPLKALEQAFNYRLYAAINKQQTEWINDKTLIFRMVDCHVQSIRRLKNLPDFPCKPVGIVEFSQFSKTIDPRIRSRCIACPPDKADGFFCGWEFTVE